MAGVFDDYLAGLNVNSGGQFGMTQGAQYGPDGKRLGGSGGWVREGFAPGFQYLKEGSEAAGALLRKGYEDKYRARAAGYAGSMGEMEAGLGGQMASQGLSGDVAQRMLLEQRTGGMQGLAADRGEASFGLNQDLAGLAKGTATEFAGMNRDQFAAIVNYIMGKKALKAGKDAAMMSMVGSAAGAATGAAAFSDPRLKRNAVNVGVVKLGGDTIPVYDYEYTDPSLPGIYRGVMAPDVEHVEGLVGTSASGFKYVDYMLLEKLTGFKFRKVGEVNRRNRRARVAKV